MIHPYIHTSYNGELFLNEAIRRILITNNVTFSQRTTFCQVESYILSRNCAVTFIRIPQSKKPRMCY